MWQLLASLAARRASLLSNDFATIIPPLSELHVNFLLAPTWHQLLLAQSPGAPARSCELHATKIFFIGKLQGCVDLIKGHQPAGKKAGVQGQTQGLSQAAKDALARALGMAAAPQA